MSVWVRQLRARSAAEHPSLTKGGDVPKLLLINPNTSKDTTETMLEIACEARSPGIEIDAATASFGVPLISNLQQLSVGADAVCQAVNEYIEPYDGIVIAAFGDPGVERLRREQPVPVLGIAQASMIEAGEDGRRFSIVTTTRELENPIRRIAKNLGLTDQLISLRFTSSDAQALGSKPKQLLSELSEATGRAIQEDGAKAVIIGGGPLAKAARTLRNWFDAPIIEPLPVAVYRLTQCVNRD
ncbi:MAG: allantoin racemase [Hyphomicrobiaceae bacterium]